MKTWLRYQSSDQVLLGRELYTQTQIQGGRQREPKAGSFKVLHAVRCKVIAGFKPFLLFAAFYIYVFLFFFCVPLLLFFPHLFSIINYISLALGFNVVFCFCCSFLLLVIGVSMKLDREWRQKQEKQGIVRRWAEGWENTGSRNKQGREAQSGCCL